MGTPEETDTDNGYLDVVAVPGIFLVLPKCKGAVVERSFCFFNVAIWL